MDGESIWQTENTGESALLYRDIARQADGSLWPRDRRAASVMIGQGAPSGGYKRVTWAVRAYKGWLRRIDAIGPSAFQHFDHMRVRWLKIHMDILEELDLARACVIGGVTMTVVTHFMMWVYIDVLPDSVDVPALPAYAGIAAVGAPIYMLLTRVLPR